MYMGFKFLTLLLWKISKDPQRVFYLCGILKVDIYLTRNENLYDVLGEVGRNGQLRGALSKQVIFERRLGA